MKIYLPVVRCGEVPLIIEALNALEAAYHGFYRWNVLVARAESCAKTEDGIHYRRGPRGKLDGEFTVPEEEQLCLARAEVIAPAYVEIVGAEKALTALRGYLASERVEWDRTKKEPDEHRRLALEQSRVGPVLDQVELLRSLNYPEIQIREVLSKYIFAPLDRLDRIEGLSLYEEEKMEPDGRRALMGEG
ncbi:MAG: hypothetical protein ACREQW_14950 [Candidatus Binatia bacterium]